MGRDATIRSGAATYQAHILPNRWVRSSLTLRFRNVPGPPSAYDEALGPGAGASGSPRDYGGFVRIYVPAGSEQETELRPNAPGPGSAAPGWPG